MTVGPDSLFSAAAGDRRIEPIEPAEPLALQGLNDEQRAAVTHSGGPLVVLAGPGTGKTRVLTSRVAHLIAEGSAEPASVLVLTFSVKAAEELRTRLARMLRPAQADAVRASTFNAFGMGLLERFGDRLGLGRRRRVMDSAESRRLHRAVARERGLFEASRGQGLDAAIDAATKRIERMINAGLTPEAALRLLSERGEAVERGLATAEDTVEPEAELARVGAWRDAALLWKHAAERRLAESRLEFDDQITLATRVLRDDAGARARCRAEHRVVLVDEFQDVNRPQLELLRVIAPPASETGREPRITVVGDDDQAIYGFRGSDPRVFERFGRIWGGVETVTLRLNYRSRAAVVAAANAVIARADRRYDKTKRGESAVGPGEGLPDEEPGAAGSVELVRCADQHCRDAAQLITRMILDDKARHPGRRYRDYAVLWSTRAAVADCVETLALEGVPAVATSRKAPADDEAVKDAFAWIRLLTEAAGQPEADQQRDRETEAEATAAAFRLLHRPPPCVNRGEALAAAQGYRAARRRAALAAREGRTEPTPGDGSLIDWLTAEAAGATGAANEGSAAEPTVREAAGRLRELRDDLAAIASAPAAGVIREIVRRAGLAHAELLDGRARAERIRSLVALVGFAESVQPRLEAPGDLAAFWRHYQDLDERDQAMGSRRDDNGDPRGEADTPDDEGDADAVRVMTAHTSKGLEFDTVFVGKVAARGFPRVKQPDDDPEPLGLLDDRDDGGGEPQDANAAYYDEQRRLFYVACTRAERRLVLVGYAPKRPSGTAPSFAHELSKFAGEPVTLIDGADVLPDDGADGPFRSGDEREKLRRSARRAAAAALAKAELSPGDEGALDEAGAALRAAAARLAAVRAAETGLGLPAWLEPERASYDTIRRGETPGGGWESAYFRPRPKPLTLSKTDVEEFERCPRCWYLKRVEKIPEPPAEDQLVGNAVHRALQKFYERTETGESGHDGPASPDDAARLLIRLGRRALLENTPRGRPPEDTAIERVEALLDRYARTLWDPSAHVEAVESSISFRYEHGPFAPGGEHAGALKLRAKIDRLDLLLPSGGRRVVDYKTGKPTERKLEPNGKDTQLGFYAMAVEAMAAADATGEAERRHTPETPAAEGAAEYHVLSGGVIGRIGLGELHAERKALHKSIQRTALAMLRGEYPRGKVNQQRPWEGCWGLCEAYGAG